MDISVAVRRLPDPGATVLGGGATFAPGGKGANQAVAAARLGAAVRMIGCVGDDDFGGRMRTALTAEGVDDAGVRTVAGIPTGLAMITVDAAGENMITVAPGANREAGHEEIAAVRAAEADADVLVISAEIPVAAIRSALAAGRTAHRVLNLAPAPPEAAELLAAGVDWLVVNESEAAAVLGAAAATSPRGNVVAGAATPVDDGGCGNDHIRGGESAGGRGRLAKAAGAAAELAARGARNAVVTAGAAGAAYHGPGAESVTVPGFEVRAVDSVGAGDTFVGALAVALAGGIAPAEAVRAAAAAGAAAATRPGTQPGMPRPADVLAETGLPWPAP